MTICNKHSSCWIIHGSCNGKVWRKEWQETLYPDKLPCHFCDRYHLICASDKRFLTNTGTFVQDSTSNNTLLISCEGLAKVTLINIKLDNNDDKASIIMKCCWAVGCIRPLLFGSLKQWWPSLGVERRQAGWMNWQNSRTTESKASSDFAFVWMVAYAALKPGNIFQHWRSLSRCAARFTNTSQYHQRLQAFELRAPIRSWKVPVLLVLKKQRPMLSKKSLKFRFVWPLKVSYFPTNHCKPGCGISDHV